MAREADIDGDDLDAYVDDFTPTGDEIETTYRESIEAAEDLNIDYDESQLLFISGFVITRRTIDRFEGVIHNNALKYVMGELLKLAAFLQLVEPAYAFAVFGSALAIQAFLDNKNGAAE